MHLWHCLHDSLHTKTPVVKHIQGLQVSLVASSISCRGWHILVWYLIHSMWYSWTCAVITYTHFSITIIWLMRVLVPPALHIDSGRQTQFAIQRHINFWGARIRKFMAIVVVTDCEYHYCENCVCMRLCTSLHSSHPLWYTMITIMRKYPYLGRVSTPLGFLPHTSRIYQSSNSLELMYR